LPSPSLPNITARRLYDQWIRRAAALDPALSPTQIETALTKVQQWTEAVPDSASDAYSWEVERPVDKRVILPGYLLSDAHAAAAFQRKPAPGVELSKAPPQSSSQPVGYASQPRYKLFVQGAQRGPFTVDEIAQQAARGEIDAGTRAWNMAWNPKQDKWSTVGALPELAALLGDPIPDPDDADGIPDPE
jgi:hypothetical protein